MATPQTYEEALDIVLGAQRALMIERHRKYGPDNILRTGVHGLIVRINDKLARIQHDHRNCYINDKCVDADHPDEARDDAWIDLSNYSGAIYVMLNLGWWTLPLAEDVYNCRNAPCTGGECACVLEDEEQTRIPACDCMAGECRCGDSDPDLGPHGYVS